MSDTDRTLLPESATPQEKALGATQQRISAVPVGRLADLWNPDLCPESLLGVLAWSLGIDWWDPDWPEAAKRQALRDAPKIHAARGTWAAVDRVLGTAEAVVTIEEGPDDRAGLQAMQGRIRVHNSATLNGSLESLKASISAVQRLAFELSIAAEEGISGEIPIGGLMLPVTARAVQIA